MSEHTPFVGDYYDVLGVAKDASTDEIKKAFRKLARECHPDVAGADAGAAQRFNQVRRAYETLADPVSRARYDRAGEKRTYKRGQWRPPGGFDFGGDSPRGGRGNPWKKGANNLDLEDIFGDFGSKDDFGFGGKGGGAPPPPQGRAAGETPPRTPSRAESRADNTHNEAGADIPLRVDVPAEIAARGGTVTLHYPRLRRSDDGRSLLTVNELYELRVPPQTNTGAVLREPRMGNAGADGAPYGELVCTVRVVRPTVRVASGPHAADGAPGGRQRMPSDARNQRAPSPPPAEPAPPPSAPRVDAPDVPPGASTPAAGSGGTLLVNISVTEALLGGRIEIDTPSGRVRVNLPPCTSSGARLRLRGRGVDGADLTAELRIVVPRELDEESRALIERFAALNPEVPREG
jgi:curved DNA-binding protein